MKKNEGFTVYELLISIILLSIIIVSLTSIIFSVRDKQAKITAEYEMQAFRGLVLNEIEKDINTIGVSEIVECDGVNDGTNCMAFVFNNDTKELLIDTNSNYISYDGIEYDLPTNAYFEEPIPEPTKSTYTVASGYNSIVTLTIPLKNYEFTEDFNISIILQYNNNLKDFTNITF